MTTSTTTAAAGTGRWPVPQRVTTRVLFCCWLAILAEGYDVGVLGAVMPALKEYADWGLDPLALGVLGSYALVGMLVGALFIGTLSDRYGRRRMLALSMIIFTSTQLGAALAPTPEVFGLFRFIGGLGMGGIIPVAAALTIEYSEPRKRSFNYGLMYSGYSLGIVAAAVVAITTLESLGWRWVVGFGALPILLLPFIMKAVPESLEYLVATGKADKAKAQAGRLGVEPFDVADWAHAPGDGGASLRWYQSLTLLFSARYVIATICFWVALFCGLLLVYGLNTWLPTIMREAGYDLGPSIGFLLVFALSSAVGGLVVGRLADRYGKKIMLVSFYALGAVGIVMLMLPTNLFFSYVFVAVAGIGSISTSLVLTGWVSDYYPSFARGTATGWALAFARVGAISGPMIGGAVAAANLDFAWNFIIFAAIGLFGALMVALIPKARTGGR
ncbi:MFS transporter [Zhihengliuella halotolerans]|uniref:MFS transporter n=1 Tax=Zhihengliuella halotolerans TaxID=370736 RepID=UPI000C7F7C20|nr:aromatic acid/H+ symport family MFS transporter [Zhihengliuella halotolerans]